MADALPVLRSVAYITAALFCLAAAGCLAWRWWTRDALLPLERAIWRALRGRE
jgi:hypothetical protein